MSLLMHLSEEDSAKSLLEGRMTLGIMSAIIFAGFASRVPPESMIQMDLQTKYIALSTLIASEMADHIGKWEEKMNACGRKEEE